MFNDGRFTTRYSEGIQWTTNSGTEGSRYRWVSEQGVEVRTRSTGEYSSVTARYTGISVSLYGNGEAVAVSRSASEGTRGGPAYLGKDLMGSVMTVSNEYGSLEERYEYDAFGKPYAGDLSNGMNLGYTGKPYDVVTGLYNYGYRDYKPEAARFTTVDPARDGSNWFAYVNNDPVNWIDLWGLACSPSDYQAQGIALIKEGSGEFIQGNILKGIGQNPLLSNGSEIYKQGEKLVNDGLDKIEGGLQQYTIGTVLSEKTLTNQTGHVDNYESPTKGYDAAKADFDVINPSNVKTASNGTIHGDLLDGTHINVREHSSGDNSSPTVEIIISNEDRIKIRY
jgi:RHS repeat-associated protein